MYQNCLEFYILKSEVDSSSKLISVISHGHFQPDPSQFIIYPTIRIHVTHTAKKNRQISYLKGRALVQKSQEHSDPKVHVIVRNTRDTVGMLGQ